MPISSELAIRMENRPGSLGKICRELAEHDVNIVALQSIPSEKTILVCMVIDKPALARAILDRQGMSYTETEVAKVNLENVSGELARAASRLGEANININYAYCGVEPENRTAVVIFGVPDVSRAATILDSAAATSAAA